MHNLKDLINQYSTPDILLDSFNSSENKYAIWGFEEIIEINKNGCFLNEDKVNGNYFEILQNTFSKWKKNTPNDAIACVGFLSYEFKKFIYPHIKFSKDFNSPFPYLWFCKPKSVKSFKDEIIDYGLSKKLNIIDDFMGFDNYNKKINQIKTYLKNGDVYQINFTDFKKFKSNFKNPFDLYLALRTYAKPQEGFFLHTDKFDILSLSPESLIKVKNKMVYTAPIKGTRHRSNIPSVDLELKKELQNSIKDKAEHLMIVDLLRNDLGKICQIGSIKVNDLYNIKSFETIHHMVTEIEGKLKENISETDIIQALFPGGSITGAPKESAMSIIDNLEQSNRKIYTGSARYIKSNGDMSFNICIRTLLKINDIYEYGIGGGIVWDSQAKSEWNEAHQKSKILEILL